MTTADYPQTRRDAVRLDVNARGWTDLSPHDNPLYGKLDRTIRWD